MTIRTEELREEQNEILITIHTKDDGVHIMLYEKAGNEMGKELWKAAFPAWNFSSGMGVNVLCAF